MTDDNQLTGKIDALIRDEAFEDGAMLLGDAGTPEVTSAMLGSIDMTMLPRDMVFSVGASFVTLAVSGKRVRHVTAASDDLGAQELIGQPVNVDDADTLQKLASVLRALTAMNGKMTMARQPISAALDVGNVGVGLRGLSKALGPKPAKVTSSVSTLMGDLNDVLGGYAQINDGSITPVKGEAALAEAFAALEPKWSELSRSHDRLRGWADKDRLLTLDGVLPDGALAHFVSLKGSQVVMATAKGSLADVATAWARATE